VFAATSRRILTSFFATLWRRIVFVCIGVFVIFFFFLLILFVIIILVERFSREEEYSAWNY
jgi:hypothetical protein